MMMMMMMMIKIKIRVIRVIRVVLGLLQELIHRNEQRTMWWVLCVRGV